MRMILIVCIVFATLSASFVKSASATKRKPTDMSDKPKSGIACQISTEKTWARSGKAEVSVVVENRTEHEMKISVVPAFHLRRAHRSKPEWDYDALWNLERTSLQVSSTALLQIAPNGRTSTAVDVSGLMWSRRNSSLLPHAKLFASVPDGRYLLWLDLTADDGTVVCSSRKAAVQIE